MNNDNQTIHHLHVHQCTSHFPGCARLRGQCQHPHRPVVSTAAPLTGPHGGRGRIRDSLTSNWNGDGCMLFSLAKSLRFKPSNRDTCPKPQAFLQFEKLSKKMRNDLLSEKEQSNSKGQRWALMQKVPRNVQWAPIGRVL